MKPVATREHVILRILKFLDSFGFCGYYSLEMTAKFAHKGLAGFMALWLSGIVFLLCCEMPGAKAAADSCPMSRMQGHCDKAKKNRPSLVLRNAPDSQEIDCCGFIPAVFDKARKIQKIEPVAHTETTVQPGPPVFVSTNSFPQAPITYSSKLYARNKIFIKNCVFRI